MDAKPVSECGGIPDLDYVEKVARQSRHLANHYERISDRVFIAAEGSWVYDSDGNKYLDFVSCYSALNVGHGHNRVKEAMIKMAANGLYAMPQSFLNPWTAACAEDICFYTGMDRVNFKNSGVEAVEAAMKIARKWGYIKRGITKDSAQLIFCENNFHGRTLGALAASTNSGYKAMFGPHLPQIEAVPFGAASALEDRIRGNTAAFIFEPIQAEGGIILPPWGYLRAVREICDKHNILMIADEIQTGFGRTGKLFACDWEGIRPDMYIFGKAMGGGLAISAVAGRADVMDVLVAKDDGSTFGGNPFAAAVSIAAMRAIVEESMPYKAEINGHYLKEKLDAIKDRSSYIKDVRGRGLLLGVELKDSAPSSIEIMTMLLDEGLFVNNTRPNVIRIAPPLNISIPELDWGIEKLKNIFVS